MKSKYPRVFLYAKECNHPTEFCGVDGQPIVPVALQNHPEVPVILPKQIREWADWATDGLSKS
eukprot:12513016-Ditylum_brightwellii.AAC.1